MERAACRGKAPRKRGEPDPFFPEQGQSKVSNEGKMICLECTVRAQCLEYAERTESEEGLWGGKMKQRKKKDT